MEKFDALSFGKTKREKLLDFKIYSYNFDDNVETFEMVSEDIAQPSEVLATIPLSNLMEATRERAWQAVDHLQNCYSAGHDLASLRRIFPTFIEYWEEYAHYSQAFKATPEASYVTAGHITLGSGEYHRALVMVCFGILLGWQSLLHRLVPIIDFRNDRDGLLENLLSKVAADRRPNRGECLRHLPYFKTLKIFQVKPEERPELMADYLEGWYVGSRREPYYDSHKRKTSFRGYWSWEAAAITVLLDIDDSMYKAAPFYPGDLVEFARDAERDYAPQGMPPINTNELRSKAGDQCPKTGLWHSLDAPSVSQHFEMGEPMTNLDSAYGLTVWRYGAS